MIDPLWRAVTAGEINLRQYLLEVLGPQTDVIMVGAGIEPAKWDYLTKSYT